MVSAKQKRAVGLFPDRPTTASALQALRDSGFSMHQVVILARNADRQEPIAGVHIHDYKSNKASEGAAGGAFGGGILGGAAGLLAGLGTIIIPGLGPALSGAFVVGEVSTAVITTLIGGAVGAVAGGLLGTLIGLGIPEDRARGYSERVARGDYLMMIKGSDLEIDRARDTLERQGIQDLGIFDSPHGAEPREAVQPSSHPHQASNGLSRAERLGFPVLNDQHRGDAPLRDEASHSAEQHGLDGYLEGGLKRSIGVFMRLGDLEQALDALRLSGFAMHKISIVTHDPNYQSAPPRNETTLRQQTRVNATDRPAAVHPAGFGGVANLLAGLNHVTNPRLGSVMVLGAEASALSSALTDSGGRGISGELSRCLGIPDEQSRIYSDRIQEGASLITIKGSGQETLQATSVLTKQGIQDWGIYDAKEGPVNGFSTAS